VKTIKRGHKKAAAGHLLLSWLLLTLLALMPLVGCSAPVPQGTTQADKQLTRHGADALLANMIDAYQDASSYHDQAELTVNYSENGEIKQSRAPLSVAFSRPGKIALNAYQVMIASDGQKIRTRVDDPQTENLDNQFAVSPAPKAFTWPVPQFDPVATRIVQAGGAGMPIQLELLLSGNPLAEMFGATATRQKLAPQRSKTHGDVEVVAVTTTSGKFEFHIHPQSFHLVRMKLPPQMVDSELTTNPAVSDVKVSVDFHNASFKPAASERFVLKQPAGAAVVAHLQLRPDGLPSELLGSAPPEFSFVTLDDKRLGQKELKDKTTALLWFGNDTVSEANLARFNAVSRKFSGDTDVAFYAVCTEPTVNSHNDVRKLASRWGVEPVVLRDIEHDGKEPAGKTAFKVPSIPCCVVLNPQGEVQVFEPGDFVGMADRLPGLVRSVQKGESLAAAKRALVAQETAAYKKHLEGSGGTLLLEAPQLVVASASKPADTKVTELWRNDTLESPGPVAIVDGDKPRIFVLDDGSKVVELSADGKTLKTIKLPLSEDAAVDQLKVVKWGDNVAIAVYKTMGDAVYLVDEAGKLLASYPDGKQKHGGIRVAALADLDNEGGPELYVGFWAGLGVHQVSMQGKRTGVNRLSGSVLSLSTTTPNEFDWRHLLSTDERGGILPLNQFMNADPEVRVPGYLVHELHASTFPMERPRNYMSLSYLGQLKVRVAALSDKYEPLWSFQLPMQVRPPVVDSGRLFDDTGNHWVMAWPDGNINLLSADASFNDFYRFGEEITGMALLPNSRFRSNPLLIATPAGVSAWQLAPAPTAAAVLPGGSKAERTGKKPAATTPRR